MKIPKRTIGGKTAVLTSRGYGSGWSTTERGKDAELLATHTDLIDLVIAKAPSYTITKRANKLLNELNGYEEDDFYGHGADDLVVNWVNEGEDFIIREYDGSEWIELKSEMKFLTA